MNVIKLVAEKLEVTSRDSVKTQMLKGFAEGTLVTLVFIGAAHMIEYNTGIKMFKEKKGK